MTLVRRATEALVGRTGPAGVVVGVDDAHLLDELSALVVHQLVLRNVATVVLTVRSGEPAPDAVSALWKDGHLRRLELQPLSQEDTAKLLETVLGGPVDTGDVRRLWRITRGNALFLRQLVDGEIESGRLGEFDGLWRWSGKPELTPGLVELIRGRMGQLSEQLRKVVELLALSEPIGVASLLDLADAAAVEEAEGRGLIEVYEDKRRLQARLGHPLYGEVQRSEMGQLRARRLRGRIAENLAATRMRRVGDSLRHAMLALESDLPPDHESFSAAARRAIDLLDFGLAVRFARAAIDAGGLFEARLVLCYALSWSGRGEEAEDESAALSRAANTDAERLQAAIPRIGNLFWTLARPEDAEKVLSDVAKSITEERVALDLSAMEAALHAFLGRPVPAMEIAAKVFEAAEPGSQAVTLAAMGYTAACAGTGRLAGVEATLARAVVLTDPLHNGLLGLGAASCWVRGLRLAGILDKAEHTALQLLELFQDSPGPAPLVGDVIYAELAVARGKIGHAIRLLRQVDGPLAAVDPGGWMYHSALNLAMALGMSGDPGAARRALIELEARHHPSIVYLEMDRWLAHGWVAAAEGAITEAGALARRGAAEAASHGEWASEAYALHTAVCFGDASQAGRLTELATLTDGPRAGHAAAHAVALAEGDGSGLMSVSGELETMGALLFAADAAAQASSIFAKDGRIGSANAATERAHRLARACDGARTPALAAAVAPVVLTEREREIVTMAGDGFSNRAIAERLGVSVRTVEGHIYRAGAKLGVSNRSEFAVLLRGKRPRG